jgi:two-component system CheB/CheR fusion protein
MTDDLLDLARLGRGKIQIQRGVLSLNEIVAEAVEAVRPALEARHHALEVVRAPDDPRVEGDPVRLTQIFINLLQNAIRYTPKGGQITVSAAREADQAVVRVRDNGVGIDPRDLPHIFDLFHQVGASSSQRPEGLGIGLTLARRLVELHGGTITAHSAGPGQGSEFVVALPLAPAEERTVAPAPLASNGTVAVQTGTMPEQQGALPARGLEVLVVEDHVDSAAMIARLLRAAGHQVHVAHDAPAALDLAQKHPPDVALLDLALPGTDGVQLARSLRSSGCLARLVALTGRDTESSRESAGAAGFAAHLVKPFAPADLLRALEPNDATPGLPSEPGVAGP